MLTCAEKNKKTSLSALLGGKNPLTNLVKSYVKPVKSLTFILHTQSCH